MINFTGGLVKIGTQYINPDKICSFNRAYCTANDIFNNDDRRSNIRPGEEVLSIEYTNGKKKFIKLDNTEYEYTAKKFANAIIEAQTTGEVIDISA